jgi:hypothetical protein
MLYVIMGILIEAGSSDGVTWASRWRFMRSRGTAGKLGKRGPGGEPRRSKGRRQSGVVSVDGNLQLEVH